MAMPPVVVTDTLPPVPPSPPAELLPADATLIVTGAPLPPVPEAPSPPVAWMYDSVKAPPDRPILPAEPPAPEPLPPYDTSSYKFPPPADDKVMAAPLPPLPA